MFQLSLAEVLNRVLNLVMQASSALKSYNNPKDQHHPFIVKEKFPPAQKNERQLQFKQTSDNAGRKKTRGHMRYIVNLMVFLHNYVFLTGVQLLTNLAVCLAPK